MRVSCLIPCYNERQRIAAVLDVIDCVKYVEQVICVDDGSTDGTAEFIKDNWPMVEVIQQSENCGKAAAIQIGLKAVTNEVVLMMDADLQDLEKEEIESAIEAYTNNQGIDMIILRRINSPWFVRWYRSDVLLSGERLIRKTDLEQVMQQLKVERYQLEVAINRYMLKHRKQVRWMPWSAKNTYKVDKLGVLDGSKREFKMYVEIVSFVGFSHMLLQLTSFTRQMQLQQKAQGSRARVLQQFKL